MVDDQALMQISCFLETLPDFLSAKVYGSFVTNSEPLKKNEIRQIDLIIAVDNLKNFFLENVSKNPYMYHLMPTLFFKCASEEQLKMFGNSCYTSHIKYMDKYYKMGVIEKKDLIEDLVEWKTFFMAGRFQKEMLTLKADKEIEKANIINKKNAVVASILLMNKIYPTLMDLYRMLCSLSYIGDERKRWHAEDPLKEEKLAIRSKEFFDREYTSKCSLINISSSSHVLYDYVDVLNEIGSLPQELRYRLYDVMKLYIGEDDEILKEKIASEIYTFLYEKTTKASREQIIKGLVTTGPLNSFDYTVAKLKKGKMKKTNV